MKCCPVGKTVLLTSGLLLLTIVATTQTKLGSYLAVSGSRLKIALPSRSQSTRN